MEIETGQIPWQSMYKLMIGSIVPRPIGWISSVNAEGTPNLAPYSFFNAICSNPPHVMFCASVRPDGTHKDTLHNVRTTGEFVVNIVTQALAEAMNLTSGDFAAGESEFVVAGLTTAASQKVRPPRVAESPIHFECAVTQIIKVSDLPGGASIVIGRVLHLHVEDALLIGTDKIDIAQLQPIGRLAGTGYARVNDFFDLERPKVKG